MRLTGPERVVREIARYAIIASAGVFAASFFTEIPVWAAGLSLLCIFGIALCIYDCTGHRENNH